MTVFAPGGTPETARPIDHAFKHLGIQELPGRPNRGTLVDHWLRRCRLDPDSPQAPENGYPWCSAFASCMVEDAGWFIVKHPAGRKLLELNNDLEVGSPDIGDICIHLKPGGLSHVGFFIRRVPGAGRIETIDGNTNLAGSREGNAVAIVSRPVDYWHRFLRPRPPESVA